MVKKVVVISIFATVASLSSFAQRRDFKRERAELAREERAERRRDKDTDRPKVDYGTNILRLAPLTAQDMGIGLGASYEKIFGDEKMIGLILPLSVVLNNNGNYSWNNGSKSLQHTYFYFNPGIKVYPFGQRRITYAVGPSLLLGYGGGERWEYGGGSPGIPSSYLVDVKRMHLGMLVNNYVNFNVTKSFNVGIEAGLGVKYIDREQVKGERGNYTYTDGINVTGQFTMTLGYRF